VRAVAPNALVAESIAEAARRHALAGRGAVRKRGLRAESDPIRAVLLKTASARLRWEEPHERTPRRHSRRGSLSR
jgi:hypothetical protein